ncbi:MAG: anaerobic glycerol-3-phosphate dehydrogenase subunit C [Desulfovibrionaceae bacterium]|nr:anaerobic glycerol-3-phosphate dehydrogenase subunit C [Desulfovibrionaceae bacterium]
MNTRLSPDQCVACTTCVVHCPVAEATPDFLGPRMIGPAYERFRLMGLAEDPSLHYCANCKNCDISCPQNVPVSSINMRARAEQCRRRPPSFRDWLLAHGELEAALLRHVPAGLKNWGMNNACTRRVLDWLGIHKNAPLPPFAARSFRQEVRRLVQTRQEKQVVFFPGCYVDVYDPACGLDMLWLLQRAGYEVIVPEAFVCCGLPLIANGFLDDAREKARRNMAELVRWRRAGIPVLTGCPSCALMFRQDLPEFFPELCSELCPDTGPDSPPLLQDAQEFLLDRLEEGQLRLNEGPSDTPPQAVAYHAPCHLRATGNGLPGLELLRRLPHVQVTHVDAGCCGISGSYGFKKEKYHIAMEVGSRLFAAVRESRAALAVSECGTCRVQLGHGTGLPTLHPVSLLRCHLEGAAT